MSVLALSGRARSRALKTACLVVLASLFLWLTGGWLLDRLRQMTGTEWAEVLSNSLSLSSILILTALGLAITFGVMRVINMAHGDLLMLGAYTAFLVTDPNHLGLNLFWAIPISFLAVGFVGYLLEVCLIRFLYGRPLDTMLATWGVGMVIQQTILLTFGTDRQAMEV